jgi:hypothetical protein
VLVFRCFVGSHQEEQHQSRTPFERSRGPRRAANSHYTLDLQRVEQAGMCIRLRLWRGNRRNQLQLQFKSLLVVYQVLSCLPRNKEK